MPLERKDRVKDQTQTTGTGSVVIDGLAPTGYRSITSAHTTGSSLRYTIINASGTEWEVGEGIWTSATNTLTRATVFASSNSGSLVNFTSGVKAVFIGVTAKDLSEIETTYLPLTGGTITGESVISVSTTGNALRITHTGASGNALLVEDDTNPDATPTLIDNLGRVVVGHTSALGNVQGANTVQVHGIDTTPGIPGFAVNSWRNAALTAGVFAFGKSRGTSQGTHGLVLLEDTLGRMNFEGSTGTAFAVAARIEALADAVAGSSSMPGRLVFSTTPSGTTTPVERMRIANDGVISLGAVSGSESLRVAPTASAVNYLQVAGATTTNTPTLSAQGSDTNINLNLTPKGTGSVLANGNLSATGSLTARGAISMTSSSIAGNPTLFSIQDQAGAVVVEWGRTDGTASTQAFDFHTGATAIDYDSRIVAQGGSGSIGGGSLEFVAATTQITGNLNLNGTARRITADFSNATVASRAMFQSSTTNGNTTVSAIPNGTGTAGQFAAYAGSDPNNAAFGALLATTTQIQIISNKTGTGTAQSLAVLTDGSTRATFGAAGGLDLGTGLREARVAMGASDIDVRAGNYFTRTISGTTTLTVSNVPAAGTAASFILDLTNAGGFTINWWSNVRWPGGSAPTLTVTGRDVLSFFTHDGGSNWNGFVVGKDVK